MAEYSSSWASPTTITATTTNAPLLMATLPRPVAASMTPTGNAIGTFLPPGGATSSASVATSTDVGSCQLGPIPSVAPTLIVLAGASSNSAGSTPATPRASSTSESNSPMSTCSGSSSRGMTGSSPDSRIASAKCSAAASTPPGGGSSSAPTPGSTSRSSVGNTSSSSPGGVTITPGASSSPAAEGGA